MEAGTEMTVEPTPKRVLLFVYFGVTPLMVFSWKDQAAASV